MSTSKIDAEIKKVESLMSTKKFAEALAIAQPLLADNSKNISLLMDLGFINGELRQYDEALKSYQAVVDLVPSSETGYAGLGFIYRKKGEFDKAAREFRASLNLKPDNAMIHYELGETLLEADNYEEAITSFNKAVQFGGSDSDAIVLHRIAQCNLGLENWDKAIETAQSAFQRDKELISAFNIIGTASLLKEDWQKAIESFETYLAKVPEDEAAQNLLAKAKEAAK
jgi:tetratricopeptide (TPR) repeat protein